MARIIYSGIPSEIKGSLGGTTFQKNAYGFSVKTKANMVKPKRTEQNTQKVYMAQLVYAWQNLTESQRSAYAVYASTYPQYAKNNPSSQLDGYAVFLRYNMQFLTGLQFILTDAGAHTESLVYPTLSIVVSSIQVFVNIIEVVRNTNIFFNVYVSGPVRDSVKFIGSRTRWVGWNGVLTDRIDITDAYVKNYGRLPFVGEKIFIRAVFFDNNDAFVYPELITSSIVTTA